MADFDFRLCRKIAIMGGAFDPIHYGHLVTAQAVYDNFDVDRVVIMPLGDAPHKEMNGAAAAQRYEMAEAAVKDNPAFAVSPMEVNRAGKTYTVDTISEIKRINPGLTIYFVMGADQIQAIETWRQPERLLKLCSIIAVTRPGFDTAHIKRTIDRVKGKYGCDIYFLEVPSLDISSTDLRERIKEGRAVKYLMPDEAEKYIDEHDLYKEGNDNA